MKFKRRLMISGPPGGLGGADHLSEEHKKLMGMGEDEDNEVLPDEAVNQRTWWKRRLEIS